MIANVSSKWIDGDLVFYKVSGTEIARFNASAGTFDMAGMAIDGTAITATAAEINKVADGVSTAATSHPTQIAEADIAYTDSATALCTIPDGAKIYSITIYTTTGFNGTTPTYDLGYAANADALLDGITLPATATYASGVTAAIASEWAEGVTSGVLIGTFAGGGTNTAGAGKLRIAYYL